MAFACRCYSYSTPLTWFLNLISNEMGQVLVLFDLFLLLLASHCRAFSQTTGDWKSKQQKKSSTSRHFSFHETGTLYRQSVLSKQEINTIQQDLFQLKLTSEKNSVAYNRMGAVVPEAIRTIFQNGSPSRLIQKVVGEDYILSTNIPVEVRVYEKTGAGMDWHIDDVLYDPPQVEVVYTLENTSDCTTRWKLDKSHPVIKETDPNSVLLLQAGGIEHCVTPLKHGRRVIIKCAYVSKDATFCKEALVTQFASGKNQKMRRARKKR